MLETRGATAPTMTTRGMQQRASDDKLIGRRYTALGVHPFDAVKWEVRSASITDMNGDVVFEQNDVEVPEFWSQTATNVVVSKYFRGHVGSPDREHSARQLIGRVVDTIGSWGRQGGYFRSTDEADTFEAELAKRGVKSQMPPELYTDPDYKWEAPGDD